MLLPELTDSPASLPGVGPKRAERLARLGVVSVADLLTLVPRRYEDRSRLLTLVEAAQAGEGLVEGVVAAHEQVHTRRRRTLKIILEDASGRGSLVCFGRNFLARSFPPGSRLRVYGTFEFRYGEIQTSSFEAERVPEEDVSAGSRPSGLTPVYPLTEGITQQQLRTAIDTALERHADRLEDELPPALRTESGLPVMADTLQHLHHPPRREDAARAVRRLAYAELFVFQLGLAREAQRRRRSRRRARPAPDRALVEELRDRLPFRLTPDQEQALQEIRSDMDRPWPMSRLLQGDVGSGKTLVALLAALHSVARAEQAALMVPTELLARQHARSIGRLLAGTPVRPALAIGSMPAGARRELAAALRDGEINLVIGTHALFSEDLVWPNLGLVIIDEQHRFGVAQRQRLQARGTAPDLLMMSATPIPRSLALTAFGDSEVSTIRHPPPGRKPVRTHLARMGNDERVYDFVRRELERGHQAYMVYPAIEAGGARGYRSAEEMHAELSRRLAPFSVGLAHSRMDGEERNHTMEAFNRGEVQVLVATSVVEVGVDVPNATCIVIEHAEVFGLAALHQLRGRVGRGEAQAYCMLVFQEPLSDDARERLRVMYESTDGFHIAEEDLRIRGPGELQGRRQSGFLDFRFADIRRDMDMMIAARDRIAGLLRDDPELRAPEHALLRRSLELSTATREEKHQ